MPRRSATDGLEPFAQRSPGFVALALDGEDASFAQVATPPALAFDPVRLHGEAPRHWPVLNEASSHEDRSAGGCPPE